MNQGGWRERLIHLRARVAEFMFGAAMSWVMVPYQLKRRAELERLFMLMTVSELLGVPLLPPPNGLRLLPFLVPQILYWRRRRPLRDEEIELVDLKHLGH